MISLHKVQLRQEKADATLCGNLCFEGAGDARHDSIVSDCLGDLSAPIGLTFRNPSPWRRFGATMHLLSPFFFSVPEAKFIERDIKCLKLLKFSLSLRSPQALPAACRNQTLLLQTPPLVQRLVRLLQRSRAVAGLTSQPQPLLAVLRALQSQHNNTTFAGRMSPCLAHLANAVLPHSGRAAFCVAI